MLRSYRFVVSSAQFELGRAKLTFPNLRIEHHRADEGSWYREAQTFAGELWLIRPPTRVPPTVGSSTVGHSRTGRAPGQGTLSEGPGAASNG
jgi:hypothetical protein